MIQKPAGFLFCVAATSLLAATLSTAAYADDSKANAA